MPARAPTTMISLAASSAPGRRAMAAVMALARPPTVSRRISAPSSSTLEREIWAHKGCVRVVCVESCVRCNVRVCQGARVLYV